MTKISENLKLAIDDLDAKRLAEEIEKIKNENSIAHAIQMIYRNRNLIMRVRDERRALLIQSFLSDIKIIHTFQNHLTLLDAVIGNVQKINNCYAVIDQALEKQEFENSAIDVKIWSMLLRSTMHVSSITEDINRHFREKTGHTLSRFTIENHEGKIYDPRDAIDAQAIHLCNYLKYIAEKHHLYVADKDVDIIVIPKQATVDSSQVEKLHSIEALMELWNIMRYIEESNRFIATDTINPIRKMFHIKYGEIIHFDFNIPMDEADFVANERRRQFERNTLHDIAMQHGSANDAAIYAVTKKLIYESIYIDIDTNTNEFNFATLKEWVNAYIAISSLCKSSITTISREKIISKFIAIGIRIESAEYLVAYLTFSNDSKDLFDCPLIACENQNFVILSFVGRYANIANLVLSQLSRFHISLEDKGTHFENAVINFFSTMGFKPTGGEFKANKQSYQYDCIFTWNEYLFVIECKCRALSGGKPVKIQDNYISSCKDSKQLNRLISGIRCHKREFEGAFNIHTDSLKIIPIVMYSMPACMHQHGDECFKTDFVAIRRFFVSDSLNRMLKNERPAI